LIISKVKFISAILATTVLACGCKREAYVEALCEPMPEAGEDQPMELMPDDDQGIIYF
jgi:hypothetical protein